MSVIDAELRRLCGKNSHPQYPLLRVGYSPASRYPAGDFTPWITRKLEERRPNDIAYLLQELTTANPGLGVGNDWWQKYAQTLYNINLRNSILFEDEKGYADLHAALFIYVLHGSLDGFILLDRNADYLARAISPYQFNVRDLEAKINAANEFIKRLRRETKRDSTAWTDYPLFNFKNLENVLNMKAPAYDLRMKLRMMSIGARQLFLDTLVRGAGQGGWSARPFGINEDLASVEVANLGLGKRSSDPELALMTYRNEELLASLNGYPVKQGWNKKYTIKYMLENAPEIARRLAQDRQALSIPHEIMEDGNILVEWVVKIQNSILLALGFMQ